MGLFLARTSASEKVSIEMAQILRLEKLSGVIRFKLKKRNIMDTLIGF